MKLRLVLTFAVLAVCLAFGSQSALATLYNVDCGTATPSPLMSGAAALGSAGDVWNAYTNGVWVQPNANIITLADSTGSVAAGVQFQAWNNSGESDWPVGNNPNPAALMEDYIEAPGWGAGDGWPIFARLTGLPVSTPFTLVVYSSGGGGQGAEITLADPSGNIVLETTGATRDITTGIGDAYQTFAGTTDATGSINFNAKTIINDWHALNGLQLNIVPEPSTIVLLVMGGLMMLLPFRKR